MIGSAMLVGAMLAMGGMARRDRWGREDGLGRRDGWGRREEWGRRDRESRPWEGLMQSAAYTFFPPTEDTDTTVGRSEEVFIGIYSVVGNDQDDIIAWGEGLDYGDASLAGTEYKLRLFTH